MAGGLLPGVRAYAFSAPLGKGTVVPGPGIASSLCKPGNFFEVLFALQETIGISEQKSFSPP